MGEVFEVYARYGGRYADPTDNVERAIRMLRSSNESGECFPIGVYDSTTNTAHIPDSEPAGITSPDYRLVEIRELCHLSPSHAFEAVETFSAFFEEED